VFHDVSLTHLDDDPRLLQIRLERPHRRNAYTQRLCDELCVALRTADDDPTIRAVVLTGAGDAFCSGGDVSSQDEADRGDSHPYGHGDVMRDTGHAVVRTLARMGTPTLASINGAAVACGLTFALACDLRIAAASARLGDTSGRFGLLPDEGGAWFFPRAMGLEAALRMSLLGEVYEAPRARELGLVGEVVPDDELAAATLELAQRLAAMAPLATRAVKQLMRRSQQATLDQTLDELAAAVNVVNVSTDVHEGVAAFLARRPAVFEGR